MKYRYHATEYTLFQETMQRWHSGGGVWIPKTKIEGVNPCPTFRCQNIASASQNLFTNYSVLLSFYKLFHHARAWTFFSFCTTFETAIAAACVT